MIKMADEQVSLFYSTPDLFSNREIETTKRAGDAATVN